MSDKRQQILAALKKLGPSKPRVIADRAGIDPVQLRGELKKLLKAGDVKATGATAGRVYALPEQKFEQLGAPAGKKKKGKKSKRAARAVTRLGGEPPAMFIPAVDAEKRLILFDGSTPRVFSEEQTTAIATLLFQHYS